MNRCGWLIVLICHAAMAQPFESAPFSPATIEALITDPELGEISGIAPSRRANDVLWVHNDAPRPAELLALGAHGKLLGRLRIDGVRARDWEDMASYQMDGKSWLLIGDIGDNSGAHEDYELIAIEEPELADDGSTLVRKPSWRLRFRYPDGAHDCEALAVDVQSRQVLVLTKRSAKPIIYSIPLGPGNGSTLTASRLVEMSVIPQPTATEQLAHFPAARHGGSPTGMDIDAMGRRAIVLTYRDVWIFTRKSHETWSQSFVRTPQRLPLPPLAQAEAISFDRQSASILVSGERLPAPLLRFDPLPQAPATLESKP